MVELALHQSPDHVVQSLDRPARSGRGAHRGRAPVGSPVTHDHDCNVVPVPRLALLVARLTGSIVFRYWDTRQGRHRLYFGRPG